MNPKNKLKAATISRQHLKEKKFIAEQKIKEAENLLLKKAKEARELQLKAKESIIARQNIVTLTIGISLILVSTLVLLLYRANLQKQRANHQLMEKNEEINQQNEEISSQRDAIEEQKMKSRKKAGPLPKASITPSVFRRLFFHFTRKSPSILMTILSFTAPGISSVVISTGLKK
ncbi:MAG: hypothetical protein HC880_09015 [Bacteroidia bacterium]|nr:hypothetical protein [Bacteroidia bacterium]